MLNLALSRTPTPEFDYIYLKWILRDLAAPRDKISVLLKKGVIVRVKKGLYVLGPMFGRPYSRHVLANLVYGPSYVYGTSALAYWGLIPERAEIISSATPSRNKVFQTALGLFEYHHVAVEKYRVSVVRQSVDELRYFLVATPEKAVVETMVGTVHLEESGGVRDWLASMRIDDERLRRFRLSELKDLERSYKDPRIRELMDVIREVR